MISTLARARGVTQSDLAIELGIHRNRLADKIAGRVDFKESEIVAAARYFGVEPGRLFEDPLKLLGVTGGSSSAWIRRWAGQRHLRVVAA
jgi:transcriptional regulator with XRE-family HTH domain